MGNLKRKKAIIILKINKSEMEYLKSKGIGFGENGMSKTHSSGKGYYATESKYIMSLLNEFRHKHIVFTKSV